MDEIKQISPINQPSFHQTGLSVSNFRPNVWCVYLSSSIHHLSTIAPLFAGIIIRSILIDIILQMIILANGRTASRLMWYQRLPAVIRQVSYALLRNDRLISLLCPN